VLLLFWHNGVNENIEKPVITKIPDTPGKVMGGIVTVIGAGKSFFDSNKS